MSCSDILRPTDSNLCVSGCISLFSLTANPSRSPHITRLNTHNKGGRDTTRERRRGTRVTEVIVVLGLIPPTRLPQGQTVPARWALTPEPPALHHRPAFGVEDGEWNIGACPRPNQRRVTSGATLGKLWDPVWLGRLLLDLLGFESGSGWLTGEAGGIWQKKRRSKWILLNYFLDCSSAVGETVSCFSPV